MDTPTNRLESLALNAHDLAIHARALERHVADAVDVPACLPAREAAGLLERLEDQLADLLTATR